MAQVTFFTHAKLDSLIFVSLKGKSFFKHVFSLQLINFIHLNCQFPAYFFIIFTLSKLKSVSHGKVHTKAYHLFTKINFYLSHLLPE